MAEFVVADASVLLKWYLSEEEAHWDQALLLFERFKYGLVRILLPELAFFELGNRLARLSGGTKLFEDAVDFLTDVVRLDEGDLKEIVRIAAGLRDRGMKRITAYDCAYIHLAQLTATPLITADRVQAEAAKAAGIGMVPLEDYC